MADPTKRFATAQPGQESGNRPAAGEGRARAGPPQPPKRPKGRAESVGSGIEALAGKIRDNGPRSGMLGRAGEAVADQLESAGGYLRDHSFSDMGKDITNLIRRYPVGSILVGLGVGFLLARGFGRS